MNAQSIKDIMHSIGAKAKAAASLLAVASTDQKNAALTASAAAIRKNAQFILSANTEDMMAAENKKLSPAMIDRLKLDPARIEAIAASLEDIATLEDPVGGEIARWQRPNGLDIARVRTPLGVIGVIYESRPNVTADAGALCLKSGNAVILRGGSESTKSSAAIHKALQMGLGDAGLPLDAIQLVPTADRAAVGEMLTMTDHIDVIVPRGGKSLVARIQADARVPVFAHLEGLNHVYIDADADPDKALDIALNAKMRRTGICGASETLLVHENFASSLTAILDALANAGCALRGDTWTCSMDARVTPASADDWDTEYLDAILAIKMVPDMDTAIAHIAAHGSGHTDCIITENAAAAESFLNQVDSAIVMLNASTQFADGGEFGMGAEIGIATGRIHARGPVGLEQLTSFKYKVRGTGQVRP